MYEKAQEAPGYTYGKAHAPSSITLADLQRLMLSVGFTEEDRGSLRMAGEVLVDQVEEIVHLWRATIIAGIPHLARHSRNLDGRPNPDYLRRSNQRFQQWIVDTCMRDYDQAWLDYQVEIARRHTTAMKNKVDQVSSTPFVPYSDIIAFTFVINDTMKDFLARKGHAQAQVTAMHRAWCKSMHVQMAIWAKPYMEDPAPASEW